LIKLYVFSPPESKNIWDNELLVHIPVFCLAHIVSSYHRLYIIFYLCTLFHILIDRTYFKSFLDVRKLTLWAAGMVEHLPSKCKALSSNTQTVKKQQKQRKFILF
jgi:hypothetical protein